jgi:PAS domain S-box-containing protein/putative nucleotidyltransferase with HDIG domain
MGRHFETDLVGIIEATENCQIIQVNSVICKMLGYTSDELLQRACTDVIHPDDVAKFKDHFRPLVEHQQSTPAIELRLRAKDGQLRVVALNVQANGRDASGGMQRFVGVAMDVTGQSKLGPDNGGLGQRVDDLRNRIGRALSDTLGLRDRYTADHQNHVARLANRIAEILGLPLQDRRIIIAAATVHDIGKAAIPTEYLTKTSKLDGLEWAVMQTHAQRGYELLKPLNDDFPVAEIVFQHHERLDGSGYPRGLANEGIRAEAQIVAAADMSDSIINARPYRRALSKSDAVAALKADRGVKLRQDVADACIEALAVAG